VSLPSPLPLRSGAPPRTPPLAGIKPKAYLVMGIVIVVLGLAVSAITATAPMMASRLREAVPAGVAMILGGTLLAVISRAGSNRQRRARAGLAAWAKAHDFDNAHPDLATGRHTGVPLSIRLGYGGARTQGHARGWLVEVGEPECSGWVIVFDKLDDQAAITTRLEQIANAAVASSGVFGADPHKR